MIVGCINEVATLRRFSYKKMYGRFSRGKSIGHTCNNEMGVLTWWP